MDEATPLNSTHDINLFKKIILYLNVSAFRITRAIPRLSNYRNNYYSRGLSVAFIVVSEYAVAKLLFPNVPHYRQYAPGIGLFVHYAIDIFFVKDIIIMSGNYDAYYNKALFYLFLVLLITGVVVGIITLNNQIGHLSPGK